MILAVGEGFLDLWDSVERRQYCVDTIVELGSRSDAYLAWNALLFCGFNSFVRLLHDNACDITADIRMKLDLHSSAGGGK